MRSNESGRILITGSIAGFTPGPFQAVYHGTKAFVDSFSYALRNELKDSGVTVTCLMPGATETEFFDRAGLSDTKVGQASKDNPADVAEAGFKAMMDGESDIVTGWQNKLRNGHGERHASRKARGPHAQTIRTRLWQGTIADEPCQLAASRAVARSLCFARRGEAEGPIDGKNSMRLLIRRKPTHSLIRRGPVN